MNRPLVFSRRLLAWYAGHARDLPWRHTRDPYKIWVSEILLQQTQVATAIPYYRRFIARFPTVRALARARLDSVLKVWEGVGYYARARNLHRAARTIVQEHGGKFPDSTGELLELPGVGRYTAGAIASIAFKRHEPVVDGNVTRVLARYFGITSDVTENRTREELWRLAERCLIDGRAGDVNQALMDLGATICTPRGPRCADCPVRHRCTARRLGLQAELPHKRPRKTIPRYTIGVGLVWKKGRLLIQRRKAEGLLGGLWEFPGGKREAGESLQACVEREVKEELGIQVKVKEEFAVVTHGYSHFSITMHAYACEFVRGRPRATSATAVRWVRPSELKDYAFPAANRKIIARLTE